MNEKGHVSGRKKSIADLSFGSRGIEPLEGNQSVMLQ